MYLAPNRSVERLSGAFEGLGEQQHSNAVLESLLYKMKSRFRTRLRGEIENRKKESSKLNLCDKDMDLRYSLKLQISIHVESLMFYKTRTLDSSQTPANRNQYYMISVSFTFCYFLILNLQVIYLIYFSMYISIFSFKI